MVVVAMRATANGEHARRADELEPLRVGSPADNCGKFRTCKTPPG